MDKDFSVESENKIRLPQILFGFLVYFIVTGLILILIDLTSAGTLFALPGTYNSDATGASLLSMLQLQNNDQTSMGTVLACLGYFAAFRLAFVSAAMVYLRQRDTRFKSLLMAAAIFSFAMEIIILFYSVAATYTLICFFMDFIPMAAWCIAVHRSPQFSDGFLEPLTETGNTSYLGGWLLVPAFWLLFCLQYFVPGFLGFAVNLISPDMQRENLAYYTHYSMVMLAITAFASFFTVWSTVMFFRRRKAFRWTFLLFAGAYIAYTIIKYSLQMAQIDEDNMSFEASLYEYLTRFGINDATVIVASLYVLFSKRSKQTFVCTRASQDADCAPFITTATDMEALPIYGLAILPAAGTAMMLMTGLSYLFAISYEYEPFSYILLYSAVAALSAWCLVLFFRRKKLFRWVFAVLAGAFLIDKAYIVVTNLTQTHGMEFPAVSLATTFLSLAYDTFLIVYVLFSRRAKNTFIYRTSFKFTKIKTLTARIRQSLTPVVGQDNDVDDR